MKYQSLQTSNGENQSQSNDLNDKVIYLIDASENFDTEKIDCHNAIEFQILATNIEGDGGLLEYQQALDGLTWTDVYDGETQITFAIDGSGTHTLKDFRCNGGYRRFTYDKGSVTAGELIIKVQNV